MNNVEALEVFEGTLLSDAGIYNSDYPYYSIALSGREHTDWLYYIEDALTELGIRVPAIYPKATLTTTQSGRTYYYCRLQGYDGEFLQSQLTRWYPEGKKAVPEDVRVTPRSLANMFMGDGSSFWYADGLAKASFATMGFGPKSIAILRERMGEVGLVSTIAFTKKGPRIDIGRREFVSRFMEMVEPYVVASYRYKIKKPRLLKQEDRNGRSYQR